MKQWYLILKEITTILVSTNIISMQVLIQLNVLLILVIEAQIPSEEDLMETDSVQFPPPASDENAVRFNNMTPMIEIPTEIIIRRNEIEGLIHFT